MSGLLLRGLLLRGLLQVLRGAVRGYRPVRSWWRRGGRRCGDCGRRVGTVQGGGGRSHVGWRTRARRRNIRWLGFRVGGGCGGGCSRRCARGHAGRCRRDGCYGLRELRSRTRSRGRGCCRRDRDDGASVRRHRSRWRGGCWLGGRGRQGGCRLPRRIRTPRHGGAARPHPLLVRRERAQHGGAHDEPQHEEGDRGQTGRDAQRHFGCELGQLHGLQSAPRPVGAPAPRMW